MIRIGIIAVGLTVAKLQSTSVKRIQNTVKPPVHSERQLTGSKSVQTHGFQSILALKLPLIYEVSSVKYDKLRAKSN
jgi:hypothetical protein